MNNVKRYLCAFGMEGVMQPFEQGDWVTYTDYLAMVDQRDAAMMCAESGNALVKQLKDQIADAMAAIIRPPAHGPGEWDGEYEAWLAAKGVQS